MKLYNEMFVDYWVTDFWFPVEMNSKNTCCTSLEKSPTARYFAKIMNIFNCDG